MMSREEILREYDTDFNQTTIISPGKFECEPIYTPYFYEAFLDGFGNLEEDGSLSFDIDSEDVKEFPELKNISRVYLFIRDDGFVICGE